MAVGWHRTVRAWRDPVMLRIFINGVASGLPWVMVGSALTLWLHDKGFQRSEIGLFALIAIAYAVNLIWAPLVDRLSWGKTSEKRRCWIILMLAVIFVATLLISLVDPTREGQLVLLIALMLVIAFAGATQDIAIDAQRIELIASDDPDKISAGAAVAAIGWWSGYGFVGAAALWLAQWFESIAPDHYWQLTYFCLALFVLLCLVLVSLGNITMHATVARGPQRNFDVLNTYWQPLRAFGVNFGLKTAILLICMILLFKSGEAFLGRMSLLFYREIGFSTADIALYSKGLGTLSYCIFAALGCMISVRYGLLKGLLIGGIAMASTNLLFVWLYFAPSPQLFGFAVVADQFTTAVSTVAFVAFISQLCDRAYTATHYAVLASLGNLSRTSLAAFSGYMVNFLGGNWAYFFVLTALMAVPSLLLLIILAPRLKQQLGNARTRIL